MAQKAFNCDKLFKTLLLLLLSLSAGVANARDHAPIYQFDVNRIDDAVPRAEPKSRYGNPAHYDIRGRRYYVRNSSRNYREIGIASWYGMKFHGRKTSSGEPYNVYGMTAAHRSLPLPTYARVTNLNNGRQVIVKINDRGPFHDNRVIDLSYAAAKKLGIVAKGTGLVEIQAITDPSQPDWDSDVSDDDQESYTQEFRYYLQVGAYQSLSGAQQFARKIANLSAHNTIVRKVLVDEAPVYRVQLGPFLDNAQRTLMERILKKRGVAKVMTVITT